MNPALKEDRKLRYFGGAVVYGEGTTTKKTFAIFEEKKKVERLVTANIADFEGRSRCWKGSKSRDSGYVLCGNISRGIADKLFLGIAMPSATDQSTSTTDMSSTQHYALLNARALLFCKSFIDGAPAKEILERHFTSTQTPVIDEHCSLPQSSSPIYDKYSSRLPFLTKSPFRGHEACREYFDLLSSTLKVDFPAPITSGGEAGEHAGKFAGGRTFRGSGEPVEPFTVESVDPVKFAVTVRGKGRFSDVKTGKGWDEEFVYLLSMVEEEDLEEDRGKPAVDEEMPGQWDEKGQGAIEKIKLDQEVMDKADQKKRREAGFEGVDGIKIVKWEIWADPLAAYWAAYDEEG